MAPPFLRMETAEMTKYVLLIATLILSYPLSALAGGIPVYDASSFTQMVTQFDQMTKDYQKQLEQLEQATKQANALTGTRSMGSLQNSTYEADLRRYLPNTWAETMNIMNAQNLGSSALGTQGLYNNLITTFKPTAGSDLMTTDPNGSLSQAFDRKSHTTYAAMATGEQSYNSVSPRIESYENMLSELDATTDLKASVDLQSRISAENGMVLNELIRLNAVQMQQKSSQDNEDIANSARASIANRYDAAKAASIFKEEE